MKLNWIEFSLMNNWLRGYIQEQHEIRILRQMSSIKDIETALEIGCGNGNGAKLIDKFFSPKEIIAIDLDEKMIELAQKHYRDTNRTFEVMDASKLNFPDNRFDAVFDFGIIHHIPNWRKCVRELGRVLKPNGELILEELSIESFSTGIGKLWRKMLTHPYEDMYTVQEFVTFLNQSHFEVLKFKELNPLKLLRHFLLIAKKK